MWMVSKHPQLLHSNVSSNVPLSMSKALANKEVTGANVLVAIFAERESHAAYFLQEQEMTRYDAVNFIAHGVAKDASMNEPRGT